jgi:hypothetical protein
MDPVAALADLDAAIAARDLEAIYDSSVALLQWIERGGASPFPPLSMDWRSTLDSWQLTEYLRTVRNVAGMAGNDFAVR